MLVEGSAVERAPAPVGSEGAIRGHDVGMEVGIAVARDAVAEGGAQQTLTAHALGEHPGAALTELLVAHRMVSLQQAAQLRLGDLAAEVELRGERAAERACGLTLPV